MHAKAASAPSANALQPRRSCARFPLLRSAPRAGRLRRRTRKQVSRIDGRRLSASPALVVVDGRLQHLAPDDRPDVELRTDGAGIREEQRGRRLARFQVRKRPVEQRDLGVGAEPRPARASLSAMATLPARMLSLPTSLIAALRAFELPGEPQRTGDHREHERQRDAAEHDDARGQQRLKTLRRCAEEPIDCRQPRPRRTTE